MDTTGQFVRALCVPALAIALAFAAATPAFADDFNASSGKIDDLYVGANDNGYFNDPDDAIGPTNFDIYSSSVDVTGDLSNGSITFRIYTNFVNTPTKYGAEYGDLFFSVGEAYTPYTGADAAGLTAGELANGWYGIGDDRTTGMQYEFGIALSSVPTGGSTPTSGSGDLWELDTANYTSATLESDDFFGTSGNHRNGQEVRVDTDWDGVGQNAKDTAYTASWSADTSAAGSTNDFLEITLSGDLEELGFSLDGPTTVTWHWAMTCGNDTTEATYDVNPVPEPTTLALMGLGIGGLVLGNRRKKKRAA